MATVVSVVSKEEPHREDARRGDAGSRRYRWPRIVCGLARVAVTTLAPAALSLMVPFAYAPPWAIDEGASAALDGPPAAVEEGALLPAGESGVPVGVAGAFQVPPPGGVNGNPWSIGESAGDSWETSFSRGDPRFEALVVKVGTEPTPAPLREPLRPLRYRVREGDTLLGIAQSFGITPETVLWANDLSNPQMLLVDQELTILPLSGVLHRTARGDSVAAIAEIYGADPVLIRGANGLTGGQQPAEGLSLIVPGGMIRTVVTFEAPPTAAPPSEVAAALQYIVKPGDNLVYIADAFGVKPSVVQAANGLMDPDLLGVGQELTIPGGKEPGSGGNAPRTTPVATTVVSPPPTLGRIPSPTPMPVPPPASTAVPAAPAPPVQVALAGEEQAVRYTVKAGDTLVSIARANGLTASAVAAANGLADANKLVVGQVLRMPGGKPGAGNSEPTPVATPTPSPRPAPPSPTAPVTPAPPTATAIPPIPTRPAAATPPAPASGSAGDRISALAQKYLGYRYVWGGHSPTGFDCTGFTWYVYKEAGLNIPQHNLPGQLGTGQKVLPDKLLAGDLVFFENTYMKGLSHVGIYLGGGRFINAETEKTGVQIRALSDPNWASRYVGASRPW